MGKTVEKKPGAVYPEASDRGSLAVRLVLINCIFFSLGQLLTSNSLLLAFDLSEYSSQ
jgi:hypothetical protein